MAVVLPVVLVLLLGSVLAAYVMYAYDTVSEAARGGARYAIVHGSMSSAPVGPTANDATVATVAKGYAPAPAPARLTVTSTWPAGTNDASSPVTVTVTYQCQLPGAQFVGLGTFNITGSTTMLITH
jgi:Flp pilus assembly protein TadG